MTAATMVAGLALALELGVTPVVAGQARAADLVTAARAQLGAGNVDSGLVLLGLALDSGSVATERDPVNALVWQRVAHNLGSRVWLGHLGVFHTRRKATRGLGRVLVEHLTV